MKRIFLAILALGTLGVVAVVGIFSYLSFATPSFTHVPSERSRLIDDIMSYSSVAETRAHIGVADSNWEIVRHTEGSAPSSSFIRLFLLRPSFTVAEVKQSEHLGYVGSLGLVFLNDRLMRTIFTPDDFHGYRDKLIAAKRGHNGRAGVGQEFTRIEIVDAARAQPSRPYVYWTDMRLEKEEEFVEDWFT